MAYKQAIKVSEARVLIFLKAAPVRRRYTRAISSKLGIEYGYLLRILKGMVFKHWITKESTPVKTYYHIKDIAPYDDAVVVLGDFRKDKKAEQRKLN